VHFGRVDPEVGVTVPIDVPPPAALVAPARATLDAPFEITWTPWSSLDGFSTRLRPSGPCLGRLERQLATDTGSFVFQPADFAQPLTSACTATVTLVRARERHAAPAGPLRDASVSARQTDQTTLQVSP